MNLGVFLAAQTFSLNSISFSRLNSREDISQERFPLAEPDFAVKYSLSLIDVNILKWKFGKNPFTEIILNYLKSYLKPDLLVYSHHGVAMPQKTENARHLISLVMVVTILFICNRDRFSYKS